ncbi:MAG TPA: sensor histidine kinase [Candidatus Limnocylindrales bacterium]
MSAPIPAASHVWVRTLPAWHILSIVTIVGSLLVAFGSGTIRPGMETLAVLLSGLLLAGYWAMFIRPRPWQWPSRFEVAYIVGVSVDFAVLLQISPYFAYLQFSLFPQFFFLLNRNRRALVVGAIGVASALVLSSLAQTAWELDLAMPQVASNVLQVAFVLAMSLWIGAIAKQSVDRQHLIVELERTRADLAAAEREAGVLEERARLAREIHDTLAQGFASVVTHLQAAEASLPAGAERTGAHIAQAESVARESLAEARALAWALRPAAIADAGLVGAIERAVTAAFPTGTVTAALTVTGTVRPLHPTVEVTLLRTVQEALTNVRRHAGASRVDVTLTYFDDAVSIDVVDDGRGFESGTPSTAPMGGLGLVGMRERAEAVGGTFSLETAPGEGTTVAVNIPTPEAAPPTGDPATGASPTPPTADRVPEAIA